MNAALAVGFRDCLHVINTNQTKGRERSGGAGRCSHHFITLRQIGMSLLPRFGKDFCLWESCCQVLREQKATPQEPFCKHSITRVSTATSVLASRSTPSRLVRQRLLPAPRLSGLSRSPGSGWDHSCQS